MSAQQRVSLVGSGGSLVAGYQVSATGANLQELVVTNTGVAVVYAQIHNLTSAPADTAVPVLTFAVPAAGSASWNPAQGVTFDTGIYVCISSTAPTKTIGAAEAVFNALVEA